MPYKLTGIFPCMDCCEPATDTSGLCPKCLAERDAREKQEDEARAEIINEMYREQAYELRGVLSNDWF